MTPEALAYEESTDLGTFDPAAVTSWHYLAAVLYRCNPGMNFETLGVNEMIVDCKWYSDATVAGPPPSPPNCKCKKQKQKTEQSRCSRK